jgi:hypothetical protein
VLDVFDVSDLTSRSTPAYLIRQSHWPSAESGTYPSADHRGGASTVDTAYNRRVCPGFAECVRWVSPGSSRGVPWGTLALARHARRTWHDASRDSTTVTTISRGMQLPVAKWMQCSRDFYFHPNTFKGSDLISTLSTVLHPLSHQHNTCTCSNVPTDPEASSVSPVAIPALGSPRHLMPISR